MDTFFNIITHLIIVVGIIMMLFYTYMFLSEKFENDFTEGLILIGTIVFSAFLYFSSKAFNISIPQLLFDGLEQADVLSFKVILGSFISGSLGMLLAWYITSQLNKDTIVAIRIILLIIILMILLFGDIYVASWSVENKGGFNKALLPNVSFVIGVLGYVIFNYKPHKQ